MTRAEAYAAGYAEGERWAERALRNGLGEWRDDMRHLRAAATFAHEYRTVWGDMKLARDLGLARGYRNTWARWDAGELTWEMLEHAPIGR